MFSFLTTLRKRNGLYARSRRLRAITDEFSGTYFAFSPARIYELLTAASTFIRNNWLDDATVVLDEAEAALRSELSKSGAVALDCKQQPRNNDET